MNMEMLNRVQLRGIVGSVSITDVQDVKNVRLSVCTNYCIKDKNGNAIIETTWHHVTAWTGNSATNAAADLKKGDKVEIEGRLRQKRYVNAEGEDRTFTEILAQKVTLLDGNTLSLQE